MDIRTIIAPSINDRDGLEEFFEALIDQTPNIERDIAKLKSSPEDREIISSLFRAVHNIKGDATLCKVDMATALVHPIETVLARFRNNEIAFTDILAEATKMDASAIVLHYSPDAVDGQTIEDLAWAAQERGIVTRVIMPVPRQPKNVPSASTRKSKY